MEPFSTDKVKNLSVLLLAGGHSPERDVSLASGDAVQRALAERGHRITRIDPRDVDVAQSLSHDLDVVFNALHGTFGEDGQVQQILEDAGIPYTGSGPSASRLAFQKSAAKERFFQRSVPTLPYVLIHESDTAQTIHNKARTLGFPLVVKPDAQGSSLGVTIVQQKAQLAAALTKCFHYTDFGLLESAIIGTEWTVGVFNELILPLIQVQPAGDFFDYQAKYEDEATRYVFEFNVTTDVIGSITHAAKNAFTALRLRGLARVDIMLDRYERPWVLEANTVPGFTEHSLVPKAAAQIGIGLGELCEQMIVSALGTMAHS